MDTSETCRVTHSTAVCQCPSAGLENHTITSALLEIQLLLISLVKLTPDAARNMPHQFGMYSQLEVGSVMAAEATKTVETGPSLVMVARNFKK